MGNVQGSAHYKMILVNYLEPAIYRTAGVASQEGCLPFRAAERGRGGWPRVGLSMVSLQVGPWWGSPSLRLLAFTAMVVLTLGLCRRRRRREKWPHSTIQSEITYRQAEALCLGRVGEAW